MASSNLEYSLKILTDSVQASLRQVQSDINNVKTNIKVNVDGAKDSASKAVNDINQTASGLTFGESIKANLIAGFAVEGIKAGISGIGNFLSDQLDGAKGLESTRVALNGILGGTEKDIEQAGKLLGDVVKFASETPFEIPELAKTAKQLAAAGFTAEEITGSLKKLGDVASGTGTPLSQITYAYGQIKTANKAYSQDLNQLQNAGIPIYQELGKQLGISSDQVKKLASEGKIGFAQVDKVLGSLTQEGGRFYKAMENQSKTLGGVLSNLSDGFGAVGRKILGLTDIGGVVEGGIFETITNAAKGLVEVLSSPFAGDIFQSIGASIGFLISSIAELASPLKQTFGDLFKNLRDGAVGFLDILTSDSTDNFSKGLSSGLKNLSELFSGLKVNAQNNFKGIFDFILGINFKPIVESIKPLVNGISDLFLSISKSKGDEQGLTLFNTTLGLLANAGKLLIEVGIPKVFEGIGSALTELSKNKLVLDAIIFSITLLVSTFATLAIIGQIVGFVSGVVAVLATVFNPFTYVIFGLGALIVGLYLAFTTNFLGIRDIVTFVFNFILGIIGAIITYIQFQISIFTTIIQGIIITITTIFLLIFAILTGNKVLFAQVLLGFIGTISNFIQGAVDKFNGFKQSVIDTFAQIFSYVRNINFGGIFNNIGSSLSNAFNVVKDAFVGVFRSGFRIALDTIGLGSIAVPFATGGLVQGKNVLALLNDGGGREFVMNAEATKKNLPLLELMNQGRFNNTSSSSNTNNTSNNNTSIVNNYSPSYNQFQTSPFLRGLNS